METTDYYIRTRYRYLKIMGGVLLLILLADLLVFTVLYNIGGIISDIRQYVIFYMLFPEIFNFICYFITAFIITRKRISPLTKNCITMLHMTFLCTMLAAVHPYYAVLIGGCLIIPVFVSALYGNVQMVNFTTIMSFLGWAVTLISARYWHKITDIHLMINFGITLLLITISRIITGILLGYTCHVNLEISKEKKIRREMEQKLLCDPMTGLYHHTAFYGFLEKMLDKKKRERSDLVVAILDLDDFKSINDIYGHCCGDEVLHYLADVLRQRCSRHYICRYGGEEFAVIFDDVILMQAWEMMETALNDMRHHHFSWCPTPITFSCGISQFTGDSTLTAKSFFMQADLLLYQAKKEGKNRCLIG